MRISTAITTIRIVFIFSFEISHFSMENFPNLNRYISSPLSPHLFSSRNEENRMQRWFDSTFLTTSLLWWCTFSEATSEYFLFFWKKKCRYGVKSRWIKGRPECALICIIHRHVVRGIRNAQDIYFPFHLFFLLALVALFFLSVPLGFCFHIKKKYGRTMSRSFHDEFLKTIGSLLRRRRRLKRFTLRTRPMFVAKRFCRRDLTWFENNDAKKRRTDSV